MRAVSPTAALDLYVTANSPGEISGWVAPLARELRTRVGSLRITVVVPPCQYASGEELELGRQAGADRCVRVGGLKSLADVRDPGGAGDGKRLVMHLGGDVAFSVYISRRLKCPLLVYSSRPRWKFFVDRYFLPDEKCSERFSLRGVASSKYAVIGNIARQRDFVRDGGGDARAHGDRA